jgi:hypothetical protein
VVVLVLEVIEWALLCVWVRPPVVREQWHVFVFSAANVWLITNVAYFESRLRVHPESICAFAA